MHIYVGWSNWYCMARNFWGIQFSWNANLQRFCDLIFADGHSRVAPLTISVRLRLLLHARHGSNLIRTGRKSCEKPASDRSIILVYLAEIEKWYKSRIWLRLETLCRRSTIMNWCEVNQLLNRSSSMMATPPVIAHACVLTSREHAFRLFISQV